MDERLDAIQRFVEVLRLQLLTGAASTQRFAEWALRLLTVEREQGAPGDPWARHLARMEGLARDLGARPRTCPAGPDDLALAEFLRLEAAGWAAVARGDPAPEGALARRLELARGLWRDAAAAFEAGAGELEAPYLASARLLATEREADPEAGAAALARHLERVLRLEAAARRLVRAAPGRSDELAAATCFRWEAEAYAHLARGGAADDARGRAMVKAWFDAAGTCFERARQAWRRGALDVERVHLWSLRQFDVERLRGERAACEAHLARVQRLERELRDGDPCPLGLTLGALECLRRDALARVARCRAADGAVA